MGISHGDKVGDKHNLPDKGSLETPGVSTTAHSKLQSHLAESGIDPLVQEKILSLTLTDGGIDSEAILTKLAQMKDELITESAVEIRARATRRGFLETEHSISQEEEPFIQQCSLLKSNQQPGFATIELADSEMITLLNNKLKFQLASKGADERGFMLIGDLSKLSGKVEHLLLDAGITDNDLREAARLAVTRRVATVIRALDSESASIIVTCRTRRGVGAPEFLPHFDGPFDPANKGTNKLEFKGVSVITGPTTKVWVEGEFDRDKAAAGNAHLSQLSRDEKDRLIAESIKGSNPQSLKQGELLIFKSGDPQQATLHTIPAFPLDMDRLIVQVNPLPFVSIGRVWWDDQIGRVERMLEDMAKAA